MRHGTSRDRAASLAVLGGRRRLRARAADRRFADLRCPELGRRPATVQHCRAARCALDADQMANAATIAAVGIRRGVPDRAVVVALATALQESKLENLDGGDRDSVGLFQQRPSQGWGTAGADPGSALRGRPVLHRAEEGQGLGEDAGHRGRAAGAAQRLSRRRTRSGPTSPTVLAEALTGDATGAVACTAGRDRRPCAARRRRPRWPRG